MVPTENLFEFGKLTHRLYYKGVIISCSALALAIVSKEVGIDSIFGFLGYFVIEVSL